MAWGGAARRRGYSRRLLGRHSGARARAVRKPELQLRHLHAARDDVDDAAEAAGHHAIDGESHHFDRREHHSLERGDPILSRPVAKIARQRPVRIVEQNIGLRTRGKRGRSSRGRGDVGGDRRDLDPARRPYLRGGFLQCLPPACNDGHVDAFLRKREGAGPPQTSARARQQRLASADPEIHPGSKSVTPGAVTWGCIISS